MNTQIYIMLPMGLGRQKIYNVVIPVKDITFVLTSQVNLLHLKTVNDFISMLY